MGVGTIDPHSNASPSPVTAPTDHRPAASPTIPAAGLHGQVVHAPNHTA